MAVPLSARASPVPAIVRDQRAAHRSAEALAAMQPLSVAIITLNEAPRIRECLDSVRDIADEIVVLDSGSNDGTAELCRGLGARVLETEWIGYGPQKNRAVAAVRNDWVLCLDADERVSPVLAASIRAALADPIARGYRFRRCNRFLGRYLRHGEGYPDWSLRLFDRRFGRWSQDAVHEKVIVEGVVASLEGDLLHDSAQTLEAYLAKQNRYTSLAANDALSRGEWVGITRMVLAPCVRFLKFYLLRRGFLDGIPGLVHIVIGCFTSFAKYAKVREGQRRR